LVLAHYTLMMAGTVIITTAPRAVPLPIAAVLSVGGLVLDHLVAHSPAAPWFAPVYYTKLLIAHAAGSV
jgi:hypothetical protein